MQNRSKIGIVFVGEKCSALAIPYRTVTEWERDNRHAPAYVLRLLEYYIRMEKLMKDEEEDRTDLQKTLVGG